MKSAESLYPLEINFKDQSMKEFCDSVMEIKTKTHRRKKYFWFLAERNLLAALILQFGTDIKQIQKQLERGLKVFNSLPNRHPSMRYYKLIKDHPASVKQSIISGLLARLVKYS